MSLLMMGGRKPRRIVRRAQFVARTGLVVPSSSYYMTDGATVDYQYFIPDDQALSAQGWVGRPYGVLVCTHGSGEQGTDNVAQMTGGGNVADALGYSATPSTTWPLLTVFPQMRTQHTGTDPNWASPGPVYSSRLLHMTIDAALTDLATRFPIDMKRLYLTGLSLGGIRMWDYLYINPTKYAAFIACASNVNQTFANVVPNQTLGMTDAQCAAICCPALLNLPLKMFNSSADGNVPPSEYQPTIDAFTTLGKASNTYWTNTGGAHANVWTTTYASLVNPAGSSLATWLFGQSR